VLSYKINFRLDNEDTESERLNDSLIQQQLSTENPQLNHPTVLSEPPKLIPIKGKKPAFLLVSYVNVNQA
jgi:hypothetical protein